MFDKNNIAIFPILSKLPIIHGFSWGQNAPNMSEAFSDANIIESRVSDFLISLGVNSRRVIVKINPNINKFNDPNILEVTKEIFSRDPSETDEIEVGGNSIFTKLRNVILVVKPADCAICILYFKNREGDKFVGLIHCSSDQTDKLLPKETIKYLKKNYDVDPKEIKIGITPAISKEFYSVPPDEINQNNWKGFMEKKKGEIFLDIVGNVLDQLRGEEILQKNIEYFREDTFTSALDGKTFSHRMAEELGLPDGRFIVAVGLK